MSVVVTSAKTVSSGAVEVGFEDGHKLTFYPNRAGFSSSEGVERVILSVGQNFVVVYNSRFQYPVNHEPFGFARVEPGYSLRRIIGYWQAAQDYLAEACRGGRLKDAWFTVAHAARDLEEVRVGKWPCPK